MRQKNKGWFLKGHHWRPRRPHWGKAWLEAEYIIKKKSAAQIAVECGVTENGILYWLNKHKIRRRSVSEVRKIKHWGAAGPKNPMYGKCGPLNPNYKDGSSPLRQRVYATHEWRTFVRSVFKERGRFCERCRRSYNGPKSLHIHHIKPWAGHSDLRLDPKNVKILCRDCHKKAHKRKKVSKKVWRKSLSAMSVKD